MLGWIKNAFGWLKNTVGDYFNSTGRGVGDFLESRGPRVINIHNENGGEIHIGGDLSGERRCKCYNEGWRLLGQRGRVGSQRRREPYPRYPERSYQLPPPRPVYQINPYPYYGGFVG